MAQQLPVPTEPTYRPPTNFTVLPDLSTPLQLGGKSMTYTHQYSSIYFVRLALLRKSLEKIAKAKWAHVAGNPPHVKRVLDVTKGKLCYILGTVYIDMPLKPNILEDIGKDDWIAAPPPRVKYCSEGDSVMLEDESGRIKLVGQRIAIEQSKLVTGVIIAALGMETTSGEFEVVDHCAVGMAQQRRLTDEVEDDSQTDVDVPGEWIALVSGLDIGLAGSDNAAEADCSDMALQLLVEYLSSEAGGVEDQSSSSQISRLIIVGNSVFPVIMEEDAEDSTKNKRYAAASKTKYSPVPLQILTSTLTDISRALPIHILPGPNDPTGTTLPQQPMPRAMFGKELNKQRGEEGFACETNPGWIGVGRCEILALAGQTLDDVFKYLYSDDRLEMAKNTLRWRHMAPTAPDTLWCYPYLNTDPFIMTRSPHIYIVGNQPDFATDTLEGEEGQRTRIVLLPRFSQTGLLVLVHTGSLEVKTVEFGVGTG